MVFWVDIGFFLELLLDRKMYTLILLIISSDYFDIILTFAQHRLSRLRTMPQQPSKLDDGVELIDTLETGGADNVKACLEDMKWTSKTEDNHDVFRESCGHRLSLTNSSIHMKVVH